MLYLTTLLPLIFYSVLRVNGQSYSCSLNLSTTDLIVLDSNYRIRTPATHETNITFKYQESFMIRCPPGTVTPHLSDVGENVQCVEDTQLQINKNHAYIYFTSIDCVQKLPATVRVSDTTCQNGGTHVEVGFEMFTSFTPIYTVCFDTKKFVPLNVTYYAPFDQWGGFSNETIAHYFVDDGHLYDDVDLDNIYDIDNQKARFANWDLSEYYTDEVYLIKGQLLPSYLFSYKLEKYAAFNYVNVVPQWSILESVFAEFVDSFISEHMLVPTVYQVGTLGVAQLNNSKNVRVDLNLSITDRKVPVPKWLWFGQPGSFTIYGYNNPYFEESEVEAEFKELCQLPISFEKFKNMLVGVCAGDPHVTI